MLWADLWPLSRGLGSHGAQLADLIATYAPRLLTPNELVQLAEQEIEAINDACARLVVICFFMMFNDLVCFAPFKLGFRIRFKRDCAMIF